MKFMKEYNDFSVDDITLNIFLTSLILIIFGLGIATYGISTIIYSLCVIITGG